MAMASGAMSPIAGSRHLSMSNAAISVPERLKPMPSHLPVSNAARASAWVPQVAGSLFLA